MKPWNKGKLKKNPIIARTIPGRYVGELLDNALRAKEKGYHKSPQYIEQTRARRRELVELCDVHGRQDWKPSELKYLEDNFRKKNL